MKRGPKPSGIKKVAYFRRLTPELAEQFDLAICEGAGQGVPIKELLSDSELEELKKQNWALVNENEKLENEKADLMARLERCARATDDQKARHWMLKFDEAMAKLSSNSDTSQ